MVLVAGDARPSVPGRSPVDLDGAVKHVDDPVLADMGERVERRLDEAVFAERRSRYLDDEQCLIRMP